MQLGFCKIFNRLIGYNVDKVNERGETRLYRAVRDGNLDEARRLLAKGANPNAPNKHGRTPMHAAAYLGETTIYEELMTKGGDPSVKDWRGRNALHSAAVCGGYRLRAKIIDMTAKKYPGLMDEKDQYGWSPRDFMTLWEDNANAAQKLEEFMELDEVSAYQKGYKPKPPSVH